MRQLSAVGGARQYFIQHAPRRPRAVDDYKNHKGAPLMSKRDALEYAHIQLQPQEMRGSIPIDMDISHSYTKVREMDYPMPQLMMINPANGHMHPVWQVKEPVAFGDNALRKPQDAFIDLQRQITYMYGADRGYGHYMVKTPGHSRWETIETGAPRYSVAELLEAIPLGIRQQASQRKVRNVEKDGRHQTLFDIGRYWAYGKAKKAKRQGNFELWQAQVIAEFLMLNSFALPLSTNQVKSLARNVARYAWKKADSLNGSVLDGEKRSLIKSWERAEMSPEDAKERMADGGRYAADIVNATRRLQRDDRITQAIGSLAARGVLNPTQAQIASEAGCSVRTVKTWYASQRQSPGN